MVAKGALASIGTYNLFFNPHTVYYFYRTTASTMRTNVKYLFHATGNFPANETRNQADTAISHTSYSDLLAQLRRDRRALLCVYQGVVHVTNDETYSQLDESRTIIALYRDSRMSPLMYNGFQG